MLQMLIRYFKLSKIVSQRFSQICARDASYLSSCSCNFVDDVSEDNILIIGVAAHLPPLRILS